MNWSEHLSAYYRSLHCPPLPSEYECMNPYQNDETMKLVDAFLKKYLNDQYQRTLLFGINPGRFGSGVTGISFTDPIRLENKLGIKNPFDKRPELSTEFIYEAIEAAGGVDFFYRHFFISAVYPLGFLKEGKNINYYELKNWKNYMLDHVVKEINAHMHWPINRKVAISIGAGDNLKVLSQLNEQHGWFNEIRSLPHPRWVMQYRRKRKAEFLEVYTKELLAAIN